MRSETVVDEELVEMAMKWAKPCQVAVGPKGNYLGQRHTAVHCRKNYWNSRCSEPKSATLPSAVR